MKKMHQLMATSCVAGFLIFGVDQVVAQGRGGPPGGRGGFDPSQMRERMLERVRELFEVKDDTEWKILEERITKVYEVQREALGSRFGGLSLLRGGGGDPQQGGSSRMGMLGGASAEADALQKAIDGKASNEQLKLRMERVREARKASEEKLKAAQEELKQVLSVRQEAMALQMGLVN
jgi:hypothetical protein